MTKIQNETNEPKRDKTELTPEQFRFAEIVAAELTKRWLEINRQKPAFDKRPGQVQS